MYITATLILIASILLYFKIANRFNIIDKPNERSSHTQITIRGGGIVFAISVLLAFVMGYASWALTLAVLMVATVSFVDDMRPLSQLPRLAIHVLASFLVMYQANLFDLPLWWVPICLIFLLGWINIFNFMDGINGITALYSLAVLVGFYLIPEMTAFHPLIEIVGISVLVFAFFNVRIKARTFAGDVGSIAMAVILGYLMIHTLVATEEPMYLLLFAVYGIDGVLTILHRLFKRENIFLPHRTHLYQYLANEMKWGHLKVSFLYFILQLVLNIFVLFLLKNGLHQTTNTFIFIIFVLIIIYIASKLLVFRKIGRC